MKIKKNKRLEKYDGVMIIPIKKKNPVLIFKMFGQPLYANDNKGYFEYGELVIRHLDYTVYWDNEMWGHEFPKEIKQQYGKEFWKFLGVKKPSYYKASDLPSNVIELSLKTIMSKKKIKVLSPDYITPVKNQLRAAGIIKVRRGKAKKKTEMAICRDKFIISEYKKIVKKTKRKRPYPIKRLQDKLKEELFRLYSKDKASKEKDKLSKEEDKAITEKYKDYSVHDATVRRVLDDYTKK